MAVASFTTKRLRVAHWKDALADPLRRETLKGELQGILTPPVLMHLPPALDVAGRDLDAWIDARAGESEVLLVRSRGVGALVGLMILATDQGASPATLHIGYLLAETAWGRGLGSELLEGLVSAVSGPCVLVGGVGRDNPASSRILEKAGFVEDETLSDTQTRILVRTIPDPGLT